MKKPFIIGIIIAIAATAWFYSDTRANNDEERPYELYQNGHYDDAIPELTKRAEKGDGKAQFFLGWFAIEQGDDASALAWWHKASENGYAPATYNIGDSYIKGERGVEKDIPLARQWLQKAVEQGNDYTAMQLYKMDSREPRGAYYAHILDTQGEIAAQAVADAAPKWLEEGVLLNNTPAFFELNDAYSAQAYPITRAAELIPAVHAIEKAMNESKTPDPNLRIYSEYYASRLLGVLYFAESDYANAFNYLANAADIAAHKDKYRIITDQKELYSSVAYHLGRMYEEGLGMERDERKARETYATTSQNAQTKDDRLAMWHLAMMQAQGRGGDVDKTSAADLLHKLESISRDDVLSPAVLEFPGAEQMDALREAIAAP